MSESPAPYTPDAPPAPLAAGNGVEPQPHFGPPPSAPPPPAPEPQRSYSTPQTARPVLPRQPWVEVDPEEYPGHSIQVWVNHPGWLYRQATALGRDDETERRRVEAWGQIVKGHNFPDPEQPDPGRPGQFLPLPPASDPEFWKRIDDRLAYLMMARVEAEKYAVSASIAQRRYGR